MATISEIQRVISSPAETPSALPIIERFRRGEIGSKILRRNTVSLSQFLRDHNLVPNSNLPSQIYDGLNPNPALIRILTTNQRDARGYQYNYRIDHSLAETFLPQLKAILLELAPPRTPEEKAQAQRQLLRVRHAGRSHEYYTITLEDAFDRLRKRALLFFSSLPDPSELADLAIVAVIPYVLGERGTFANFTVFKRFFNRVLRRKRIDWFRSSKRREIAVDPQEPTGVLFQAPADEIEDREAAEEAMREFLRRRLPQDQARLLEKRIIDKQAYKAIAAIDEKGRNVAALRQAVRRAKLALRHPERKLRKPHGENTKDRPPTKREKGQPLIGKGERKSHRTLGRRPIPIENLVEEYARFRSLFLARTGVLPNSSRFNHGRKEGETKYSWKTYATRFGNGDWSKAQAELERLIKDSSTQ